MARRACIEGGCMAGGLHGRGLVWQGGVMAGGVCGRGTCMAGGHAWQRVCVAGGVYGGVEACVTGETAIAADGTHPTGMHSWANTCLIQKKLEMDKIKSTSAQCTMKPKFR